MEPCSRREIASYTPDYVVFAGFMRIVDAQLVARFENRIINTHPALLPSFPGRTVCGMRSPTALKSLG